MKNLFSLLLFFGLFGLLACNDQASTNNSAATAGDAKAVNISPKSSSTPVTKEEEVAEESAPVANQQEEAPKPASAVKTEKPAQKPAKEATTNTKPKKEVVEQQAETAVKTPASEPKEEAPIAEKVIEQAPKTEKTPPPPPAPKAFSHDAFDQLLRKYVSATGKVNYKGLKSNQAALEAYIKDLADNPISDSWSRNQKMAYWINAYNAFTIKLILDNYPVKSITELHGGKPWDQKWIKLGGKTYSLNNIENDILRPQYKDARIHFAVNCAAKSCPPLLNRAWTAKNLLPNFEAQAKAFINNPQYNQLSGKSAEVSKIFDWYGEDFGSLVDYLNIYAASPLKSNSKITYKEYDWALNE